MGILRFADLQSRPTPDILSTRNFPDVGLLLHASRCVSYAIWLMWRIHSV
jgi:hypothetical protein